MSENSMSYTMAADTITISDFDTSQLGIDFSTLNIPPLSTSQLSGLNYGIYGSTNPSQSLNWSNSSLNYNTAYPSLEVKGDAHFDGNIKWRGRDLGKFLESIEDRLAIVSEPDPEKLEKFAALKKAYEHYKTLERLIGDGDIEKES